MSRRLRGVDPYSAVYELLRVSNAAFADSVEVFERCEDQELGFTDAATVALCDRHGIDAVLSFDDDFDGLVDRIDPSAL